MAQEAAWGPARTTGRRHADTGDAAHIRDDPTQARATSPTTGGLAEPAPRPGRLVGARRGRRAGRVATAAGTYFTTDFGAGLPATLEVSQGAPQSTAGTVTFRRCRIDRSHDRHQLPDRFVLCRHHRGQPERQHQQPRVSRLRAVALSSVATWTSLGRVHAVIARSIGNWLEVDNFINNLTVMAAPTPGAAGTEVFNRSNIGPGSGPYSMQLEFDAATQRVVVFADGAPFGPSIDVSGYDFSVDGYTQDGSSTNTLVTATTPTSEWLAGEHQRCGARPHSADRVRGLAINRFRRRNRNRCGSRHGDRGQPRSGPM